MRTSPYRLSPAVLALFAAGCSSQSPLPTSAEAPAAGSSAGVAASGSGQGVHQEAVKLRIDQSNATSDGLSLGNGLYGQTFTPKAKNLAQVDVRLTVNQLTADLPTTLGLYTTITGSPIATATATVAAHAPGELSRVISYRFEPPVTLARGTAYIIGMQVPSSLSWEFTYSDPYGGGQVILFDGTPLNPTADFVFTTYELK